MIKMKTKLDFRPFRAWRYDSSRVEVSQVIAPPYDVISRADQEALYAQSPHNVIRLILGKEPDFHERAARLWQDWTREGILVQESRPAIYLYEQSFTHPLTSQPLVRTAVVGTLKLEESGAVFRHEATFDAPKKDRMLLLEKTQTNLSPIFGLYRDSGRIKSLLQSAKKQNSLCEARDFQGVLHRLWAMDRPEDQKVVHETLTSEKILIADGHHRYETALEYQHRMREKFPGISSEEDFDFVMMALVATDDPGLLVLPTHRVIRSLESTNEKAFLDLLHEHFEFTACPDETIFQTLSEQPKESKVFGLILPRGSFLIRLKDAQEAPFQIEAAVLGQFISGQIEYTRFSDEALQAVRQNKAPAAFLMRSPEVDTIRELAYSGQRMPQKTTYFYPKLASGLLFYHHGPVHHGS